MTLARTCCLIVAFATSPVLAQDAKSAPAPAAQAFQVFTNQSVASVVAGLQAVNKTETLVTGDHVGTRLTIQHEKNVTSTGGEVHAETDDVFIILEGSTTLMVGGTLEGPTTSTPGEWKGTGIRGGREVTLNKGDVAFIPRGTPHRRTTPNQEVTLMVIKATNPAGSK